MRRIHVLIVLVVIFAALLMFSRSVAGWQHYVVAGDAGMLLYSASFDGGSTDGFNGDWSQYPGRLSAQITDGQMQISIGAEQAGAYSVALPHFGDFDLRVNAQAVAGPIDNSYGVVFRLQNKDNSLLEDDNYYLFLVSSDGYYQVSRAIDGKQKELSTWIQSAAVKQGLNTVNLLRVIARGDQFHFFINDQPVSLCIPDDPTAQSTINPVSGECMGGAMKEMLTDDTIPNGQVGVVAKSTDTGGAGVVAAFDNLLVYVPPAS